MESKESTMIERDALSSPRSDSADASAPSSPGSKRAVDDDTEVPSAKAVCVCCGECGRAYQSPLDLPPVVITAVTSMTPDKIERRWTSCFPSNGAGCFDAFLGELCDADQATLRAIYAAQPDEHQRVAVTMANGDSATCVITVNKWCDRDTFYHFQLMRDVLPRVSPAINAAAALNPFVVNNTSVSVRAAWTAVPLKSGWLGMSPCPWIRNMDGDNKGYYLGITSLQFDTSSSGHFALELFGDGPNFGSAGGPTYEQLATLYCVDFTLTTPHTVDE